ncbi:murein transglycosylase A [Sphingomonas nostoxanthinifaciens]|uniref:murein transglycosylase A n=1 Tax=Sphingomonas nostoxanthinifaciens TaxID=2872652 RepID=UPI0037DA41D0|nr:murein transglycosylase A [Sphingomonas nostoxanthinifaciens]
MSARLRVASVALLMLLAGCVSSHKPPPRRAPPPPAAARPAPRPTPPPAPPKPRDAVTSGVSAAPPVSALDITSDSAAAALAAFRLSCPRLLKRTDVSGLTQPLDWKPACDAAAAGPADPVAFFRDQFETVLVGGGASFATGYYEPEIEGSRTHDPGYDVPIYRRPPDLIDQLDPTTGKKLRGRMQDGGLAPYYERAEIDGGALGGQGLELAWAKDPYEFFFLQIQGSGRLLLPDGTIMRIGYDGQNGREYVGIGRLMRDRGIFDPNNPANNGVAVAASMQGMMGWMRDHPDDARAMMEQDKSYVFFHELTGAGPIGALGVAVAGHVSVAADPNYVPLGAPVWLSMDRPEATGLWVAQDTGGAIKGANRFDTFWGAGPVARITAGGMSARGQALVLVPRGTLARINGRGPSGGAPAQP